MKILYYDCFAGISGDMNLGALVDLGVERDYLLEGLNALKLKGYEIDIRKERRRDITGTRVEVHAREHHDPRTIHDIEKILTASGLSGPVRERSLAIFHILARAEARVHGTDIADVHFHEIGAVDSIIDIVGAALCLSRLDVDRVFASPVEVGGGFVSTAHGTFPVPAPATVEILKGIPMRTGAVPHEATTPTGAAILAATVSEFTERVRFRPREVGYGIGARDTEIPNVLRVMLGETGEDAADGLEHEPAFLLECNIDDMNPEFYDHVMDRLFTAGARDVYLTPIIMKKSRPAVTLSVLCTPGDEENIRRVLLRETSTLGVRKLPVERTILKRDTITVVTRFGPVRVKRAFWGEDIIKSKPEFEDVRKLADEQGVSIQEILEAISKPEPS